MKYFWFFIWTGLAIYSSFSLGVFFKYIHEYQAIGILTTIAKVFGDIFLPAILMIWFLLNVAILWVGTKTFSGNLRWGRRLCTTVWALALITFLIPPRQFELTTKSTMSAESFAEALKGQSEISTQGQVNPRLIFDLNGYSQVPDSNVSFDPVPGSTFDVGNPPRIKVTSAFKRIHQVILIRVNSPNEEILYYSTSSPHSILFLPKSLHPAHFVAEVVYDDHTFSIVNVDYTLQLGNAQFSLNLEVAPILNLRAGEFRTINTYAMFSDSRINVTHNSTYSARSHTSQIFEVTSNGTLLTTGPGTDTLDISFQGKTISVQIIVSK